MKPGGAIDLSKELPDSEKTALLTLLADEDPAVYEVVRARILSYGPPAAEWLRNHLLAREPTLRRRVHEIVRHFDSQAADDAFLSFCLCHGQDFDIEEGAWLLARTQYPEINIDAYRAVLDSYASDLRERVDLSAAPRDLLNGINAYLFGELGYTGNQEDYYDAENNYLNRVIDRRTGNPIGLCLLYLLVARRLRLPMTGIGLPGHFVCRYQTTAAEYYLDAFHNGKLLTKADCIQRLLNASFSVKDDYLTPASPRRLLLRMCANLHQIYLQADDEKNATRMHRYLVALGR